MAKCTEPLGKGYGPGKKILESFRQPSTTNGVEGGMKDYKKFAKEYEKFEILVYERAGQFFDATYMGYKKFDGGMSIDSIDEDYIGVTIRQHSYEDPDMETIRFNGKYLEMSDDEWNAFIVAKKEEREAEKARKNVSNIEAHIMEKERVLAQIQEEMDELKAKLNSSTTNPV